MSRAHKTLYNQIDLEATQLFKLSRRPRLRRSSLRLIHQPGRTRRGRNSFTCRVVKYWNRLPLAVALVPEQRTFKNYMTHILTYNFCSLFHFRPNMVFFGKSVSSRSLNTYIHCRTEFTDVCLGSRNKGAVETQASISEGDRLRGGGGYECVDST